MATKKGGKKTAKKGGKKTAGKKGGTKKSASKYGPYAGFGSAYRGA
jgi:hypothetical protein